MIGLGFADGDLWELKGQNYASDLQETHLPWSLIRKVESTGSFLHGKYLSLTPTQMGMCTEKFGNIPPQNNNKQTKKKHLENFSY